MKRVIRASKTTAEKLYNLEQFLLDAGVSEHTMLEHFFDYLPAADSLEILKDLADECDIDYTEEDV